MCHRVTWHDVTLPNLQAKAGAKLVTDVVLSATNLTKRFPTGRSGNFVNAVNGVDLSIRRGEVLGMVGESGSGKTTLLEIIRGLIIPQK